MRAVLFVFAILAVASVHAYTVDSLVITPVALNTIDVQLVSEPASGPISDGSLGPIQAGSSPPAQVAARGNGGMVFGIFGESTAVSHQDSQLYMAGAASAVLIGAVVLVKRRGRNDKKENT